MATDRLPLIVLTGPTASGKSDAAVLLCQGMNAEVVSADSMQVYRGMDIGTAKPDEPSRRGVLHHMVDVADPDQDFSVYTYRQQAMRVIADIHRRGKVPLLTGGTGLYIDAVVREYDFSPVGEDPACRRQLALLAEEQGPEALHRELISVDPESARMIHPHNIKRVIRALEVYRLSGRRLSERAPAQTGPWSPLICWGLAMEPPLLRRRIDARVDAMMEKGLLGEVEDLRRRFQKWSGTARQALGYKELLAYLDGECSLTQAVERIKLRTRQYAKRQMTWFRRDPLIRWLPVNDADTTAKIVQRIANNSFEFYQGLG